MEFLLAKILSNPPLEVQVRAEDAKQLADLTGCSVRIETVFEPTIKAQAQAQKSEPTIKAQKPEPTIKAQKPEEPKSAPSEAAKDTELRLSERMLARINAQPTRSFRSEDFSDLAKSKQASDSLQRLATRQKLIARTGPGEYMALPQAPPQNGLTTIDRVLAFMRAHAGTWFRTDQVLKGSGLPAEKKTTVASALNRLVETRQLIRREAGSFCYPAQEAQPQ